MKGNINTPANEQEILEPIEQESRGLGLIGRTLGKFALIAAIGAGAGTIAGATMDEANITVGPHEALATVTMDSSLTLDIGPGSIIMPLENSTGLGAYIELGEIPGSNSDDPEQLELFTSSDLEQYAQFFSTSENDRDEAVSAIAGNALGFAPIGSLAALGLYGLVGKRRWGEIRDIARGPVSKRVLAGVMVANIATACTVWTEVAEAEPAGIPVSSVFDGTPLEGARVTGKPLQILLNQYGPQVLGYIERNDDFYDQARVNMATAFENEYVLTPSDNYMVALFHTDEHLNFGMAELSGQVARLSEAELFLSAGDLTASGTELEGHFISHLGRQLPDIPRIVVTGNHDSDLTEKQLRDNGFRVLDGEVVEVSGLRILGDDDPRRSVFGQPIRQENDETVRELGNRLNEIACADENGVDIMLIHDPAAVEVSTDCAQLGLSGHRHNGLANIVANAEDQNILHLTGDSMGGAEHDRPTYGPLQTTASMYLLKINRLTGQTTYYQAISVHPDTSVTLEPPVYIPQYGVN